MSSNLVLVISENRPIGSEILLCLDSAGFEGRQCSLSQAVNDIDQSLPLLAIFDTALIDIGRENSFDDSLFAILYNKNISLLLLADQNRDVTTIYQKSGAREVLRTNNLSPALFKWLTNNKNILFTSPASAEAPMPPPMLATPPRPVAPIAQIAPPPRPGAPLPTPVLAPPPRPLEPLPPPMLTPPPRPGTATARIAPPQRHGSAIAPSIAPPPRPGSAMVQSIAPPPRPGSAMAQSIAPPPRPGSAMAQSIAPPPRPGSAMAQPVAPQVSPGQVIAQPIAHQTRPDSNLIANTFSPVAKPLVRNSNRPVTVSAQALESTKKPLPPVVGSELLEIPEESKELPPTINIAPPEAESTETNHQSKTRHILIIDKNPLIQHTLRQLAYTGLAYEWASNITDGAILLKDEHPAGVLIQECLEELSGPQACNYIKNIPTYKDLPIFIITKEDTSLTEEEIIECGANGSIQEPFTSDCLIRFLAENNLILSLSGNNSPLSHITDGLSLTISTARSERGGVRKKNDGRRRPPTDELPEVAELELTVPDVALPEIAASHITEPKLDVLDLLNEAIELPELDNDVLSISPADDDLPDIVFPGLDP